MRKNYKILYAEDEKEIRETYINVLSNYFDEVYSAADGQEAYELYLEHKPDVLMLDINMPILNGLDLAKKIREGDKRCKIIVLSAYTDKEKLLKACELNLIKYLVKPIKTAQLSNILLQARNELTKEDSSKNILVLNESLIWDKENFILFKEHNPVKLTKNETKLINLLVSNKGKLVSYIDIINYIWFEDTYDDYDANKLRVLTYRLNKKLSYEIISSRYGQGYQLNINY